MAKECKVCHTVHEDGDCPLGGGGGGDKDKPKVPRHKHEWKWKRRSKPLFGRPYDEYECTYPGCTATDQRPV